MPRRSQRLWQNSMSQMSRHPQPVASKVCCAAVYYIYNCTPRPGISEKRFLRQFPLMTGVGHTASGGSHLQSDAANPAVAAKGVQLHDTAASLDMAPNPDGAPCQQTCPTCWKASAGTCHQNTCTEGGLLQLQILIETALHE